MTDELEAFIAEMLKNPEARAAYEDAANRHVVIDRLVARRKEEGLSQNSLADSIGITQPTVSQFETETSDPRLSTVQRYARAVGARVELVLVEDD